MVRTKKEDNPRLQIFFELLNDVFIKGDDELTSRDFVKRENITNKCFRNINRYCNELVEKGFLIFKGKIHEEGERITHKEGFYPKRTEENSYLLNWDNFIREIIKQLVEKDFIEPDKETIESIKDVLKSQECKEFYQKTKNIGFEKSFFRYLFNPELLNKNISFKLKRAINLIEKLKEKNKKFEERLRGEHCQESKIPKDYLIKPFLKKSK